MSRNEHTKLRSAIAGSWADTYLRDQVRGFRALRTAQEARNMEDSPNHDEADHCGPVSSTAVPQDPDLRPERSLGRIYEAYCNGLKVRV